MEDCTLYHNKVREAERERQKNRETERERDRERQRERDRERDRETMGLPPSIPGIPGMQMLGICGYIRHTLLFLYFIS